MRWERKEEKKKGGMNVNVNVNVEGKDMGLVYECRWKVNEV
jgi:hypothetical protein